MIEIIRLEWRKQRIIVGGMGAAFFLSLPFGVWFAVRNGHPGASGLDGAFYFWSLIGLPLFAVLLGASGGAGLASEPAGSAEELLPVSPRARAGGAFITKAVAVAFLALLILGCAFILSAGWREMFLDPKAGLFISMKKWFALAVLGLCYLTGASFIFAHGLRQGLLGGIIGAVLGGFTVMAVFFGLGLEQVFAFRAPFGGWAIAAGLTTLLGCAGALFTVPALVALRPRGAPLKLAGALVFVSMGAAVSGGGVVRTLDNFLYSQVIAGEEGESRWGTLPPRWSWTPGRVKSLRNGVLMQTMGGGLEFVTEQGERKILIKTNRQDLRGLIVFPLREHIVATAWDMDQSLWVIKNEGSITIKNEGSMAKRGDYVLYHGTPEGGLEVHSRLSGVRPRGFVPAGRNIGILAEEDRGGSDKNGRKVFAPVPEKGRLPEWSPVKENHDDLTRLKKLAAEGLAARVSKDGRTLTAKDGRRWRLPGKAHYRELYDGYTAGMAMEGGTIFTLIVRFDDGDVALAEARPDGAVRTHWKGNVGPWTRLAMNNDGSLVSDEYSPDELNLVTKEGEFLPVLLLSELKKDIPSESRWYRLNVVRLEKDRVWVVLDDRHLVELDVRTGKLLKKTELPDTSRLRDKSETCLHSAGAGLFVHDGDKLHLVSWDGRSRVL